MKKRKVLIRTNNVPPLLAYKCEQAVRLLEEQVTVTPNVESWAEKAGVSRRWLCKTMKLVYGKPPKIIIREMRYEKVVWLICDEGLEAGCYSVAVDAGFNSVSGLSKFLSKYHDTNFTNLKADLLTKSE